MGARHLPAGCFQEYCSILGISINEFLAGEDIAQENIVKKSEDNLIQVTTDSKHRQNKLKAIIAVLSVIVLAAVMIVSVFLLRANQPKNYIVPVDPNSAEMKTAELLSGMDGAFLYHYRTSDSFQRLTVSVSEYQSGKRIDRGNNVVSYESIGSPAEGMIVIVPNFEDFTVKLVIADQSAKLSTEIPILDAVEGREYFGRSASQIEAETDIRFDEEQYILALIYDNDIMHVLNIQEFENGNIPLDNDYMYIFSVSFSK